ncbi:MAG: nicotinate phosphoribosyltransferase [Pseudomonadota bacterium]
MTAQNSPHRRDILAQHSALWADQYALTMAQALFANDKHEQVTSFHGYIRTNPFQGGYLLTAGQNILMDWLENWKFDDEDIELLRQETVFNPQTRQDERLYSDAFLDMLKNADLDLTVDMMPEGEVAFPDEPIIRVNGPVWQCLLVEAAILNTLNSQSLFATLASRLREVANGKPVLEFGVRRAQMLGGLEATRAAYIGGIDGTSNYLAKKHYGIPTTGTMAHALVMLYEEEIDAFADYAKTMPGNTVFLVDTYDTLNGVKKAIALCKEKDIPLKGIRLDSGDLAYLSKQARALLDDAGFEDAKIAASNDLDEMTIQSLQDQGAKIDIWAVGTSLVTSKAQPALGGVYKLGAIYDNGLSAEEIENLRNKNPAALADKSRAVVKLSEQTAKTSIPGDLEVLRFMKKNHLGHWQYDGDTIISRLQKNPLDKTAAGEEYPYQLNRPVESVRKSDETLSKVFNEGTHVYRVLKSCFKQGKRVREIEDVHTAKKRAEQSLMRLDYSHKRLLNAHVYVVGLENTLFETRRQKILSIRRKGAKHNG